MFNLNTCLKCQKTCQNNKNFKGKFKYWKAYIYNRSQKYRKTIVSRRWIKTLYTSINTWKLSSVKHVKGEQAPGRAETKFSTPRNSFSCVSGTVLRATFIQFLLRSRVERRRNFSSRIFPSYPSSSLFCIWNCFVV